MRGRQRAGSAAVTTSVTPTVSEHAARTSIDPALASRVAGAQRPADRAVATAMYQPVSTMNATTGTQATATNEASRGMSAAKTLA
jgi:hypothetical protein